MLVIGEKSTYILKSREIKQLFVETERVWKLLGEVDYSPSKAEKGSIIFRHFVYKVKDINAGDVFRKKTGS